MKASIMHTSLSFVFLFAIFVQLHSSLEAKSLPGSYLNRTTGHPVPNGGPITVRRDLHDHIYNYGCLWAWRMRSDGNMCTCKNEYGGTIVSQSGDNWDCNTNRELDCDHSLGGEDGKGIYIIEDDSRNSVEFVPILPPHLTIKNIFVWNYGKDGRAHGFWEKVTDVALYFISLRGNGDSLSIQNLDLEVWKGHVIKVHFGEYKKCVHAKIRGRIHYPFNVTEFKQKVMNTTIITTAAPKTTTPGPTVTTSSQTSTPGPTVTTSSQTSTSSKTTPKTTTTPKKKKHSTESAIIFVVAILLIIVLVVTASYFVYKRCKQYRSALDEEKTDDVIFKNTNYYQKSDVVKPADNVAIKNGKPFVGLDNAGHDHETVDEVGQDVAEKSTNGDVKRHDAGVKSADAGYSIANNASTAQLCKNLYSDAIDETSSEEDIEKIG